MADVYLTPHIIEKGVKEVTAEDILAANDVKVLLLDKPLYCDMNDQHKRYGRLRAVPLNAVKAKYNNYKIN